MIRKVGFIALSIALVGMLFGGVKAQNTSAPLVLDLQGDFWGWYEDSATLKQLTNWGYNDGGVMSPDGQYLAYYSLAQVTVDAIRREGGFGGGRLPGNIWVLNLTTGDGFRTVDQPEGASFFTEGVPDKAVIRSSPFWSPDSSQLAWTEIDYPEDANTHSRLVVYDLATQTAQTLVENLPIQFGVVSTLEGVWGQSGIVLFNEAYLENAANSVQEQVLVFSDTGEALNVVDMPPDFTNYVGIGVVVSYEGREYVAEEYPSDGQWTLFDVLTGEMKAATSPIWGYSPTAPDTSLQIQETSEGSAVPVMTAQGMNIDLRLETGYHLWQVALAPDGNAVAWWQSVDSGSGEPIISIWRNGSLQTVNVPDDALLREIVWAPTAWRIGGGDFSLDRCAGLQPHLVIGNQGQVIAGSGANNLRAEPSTSGEKIGEIPENGVFTVEDGPVCSDGRAWWQVNYGGLSGWTVEVQDGTYFVEPLAS